MKKTLIKTNLLLKSAHITPETRFNEDLGMDSLDSVELLMAIEKKFNISIQNEAARNAKTITDLCNCIQQELEKQNPSQIVVTKNLFQKIGKTR